jgi:hypothetical protein
MSNLIEATEDEPLSICADGESELREHLIHVEEILREAVGRFRERTTPEHRTGLDGVAIFDHEIDTFLTQRSGEIEQDRRPSKRLRSTQSEAEDAGRPIATLRSRFGLSSVELDALLLCVAAEIHPRYGRVFAYLNNDITRQRPSVGLIIDILAATWTERLEARRTLAIDSTLFRSQLLVAEPGYGHLATELSVDPAVLEYLLGRGWSHAHPVTGAECDRAGPGLGDLLLAPSERSQVENATRYLGLECVDNLQGRDPHIVVLSGAPGVGRSTVGRAMSRALGAPLRIVDGTLATPPELTRSLRDARLFGEVPGVYLAPCQGRETEPANEYSDAFLRAGHNLGFLFIEADEPPRIDFGDETHALAIHLSTPAPSLRARAWKHALHSHGIHCDAVTLRTIGAVYPFNIGRVHAIAREAERRLELVDPLSRRADLATLARICRENAHHGLDRLAQQLPTRHDWDDLVLPSDEMCRLKEIANAVRNRDQVHEQWGFGEKVAPGPGVNAIFFGPSGTGKTTAASILAADLGMAIYRVDLSRVVSKYIGETEQNLDALFNEARRSHALLFFDEAEAIFGKRSEVKDAHDRYANIEVAYLLQRMESFEGVAILATNLRKNMDNAFLRRIQFAVEFPLPKAAERLQIWTKVWPPAAELGADLDLEFMADHLELAGGHIRNVAMMAAFLACEESTPISMAHLVCATRREYQKLGRHCMPDEFGPYASLADGGRNVD